MLGDKKPDYLLVHHMEPDHSANIDSFMEKYPDVKLVLASSTYNGDILPYMKEFIHHLIDHNYQKRDVALIENGMWAPMANKNMRLLLDDLKDINIIDTITIKGMVSEDVKNKLNDLTLILK